MLPNILSDYLDRVEQAIQQCNNVYVEAKFAITRAGRRLVCVKSENGKGTTTTSPFTNSSMLHPPLNSTSLFAKKIH